MSQGADARTPRGNGTPRIAETPSGILNSVGLQNPGIDAFLKDIYPRLSELDTVKIANVAGRTTEDYVTVVRKLAETDIPLYEINVSCPNVKVGGRVLRDGRDCFGRIGQLGKESVGETDNSKAHA